MHARTDTAVSSNEESTSKGPVTWHVLSTTAMADTLGIALETPAGQFAGLSQTEVRERQEIFGKNTLGEARSRSVMAAIFAQCNNIIVYLLLAASLVAFLLDDVLEAVAILFVIIVNGAIGFFMEWRAERALLSLREHTVPTATTIRDGTEQAIPATELVPGDLVLVAAGDRIPADGRLIEAVRLHTVEAALTGESLPIEKTAEKLNDPQAALGDRVNMVFMGTAVVDGRGRFIVTETGAATQMGRIGQLLSTISHESTPLERKLRRLGNMLVVIVLALCSIITLAGWYRGNDFLQMLEVGISLAIAAVPEGLPAVATMALALGMQRMATMRTIIRRLPAVETLGATTVVCTDKTGTLTKNEMTVCAIQLGSRRIALSGSGYAVEGDFKEHEEQITPKTDEHLTLALTIAALCNDASLNSDADSSEVIGDPTEVALLVAARKGGLHQERLHQKYPRVHELPFTSDSKRMATWHRTPENKMFIAVKGALSELLNASSHRYSCGVIIPLTEDDRAAIRTWNNELAGKALRVLALAYQHSDTSSHTMDNEDIDHGLIFVGLVGMIDPLREEAQSAIAMCRDAGIRVVMITGDQVATAIEIGTQLGIMNGPSGERLRTVHGRELSRLGDENWVDSVMDVAVFARVSPEHKLRIVEGFKSAGHVVAMTGDGVNDAPALKRADIGIAMGIKGSEVAKDASDMIITDDNFATIVYAIEQGRIIYSNIIRFVHYLFSCNLSEIFVIFFAILMGWPLPLSAIQLLWLNMVTDIFPALALVLEPSSPGMMQRHPRNPNEPIISKVLGRKISLHATLIATATLAAFWIGSQLGDTSHSGNDTVNHIQLGITMAFTTLAFSQTFYALSARSQSRSLWKQSLHSNWWLVAAILSSLILQILAVYCPPLQRILHTVPLGIAEMVFVLVCSVAPVIIVEGLKLLNTPNSDVHTYQSSRTIS